MVSRTEGSNLAPLQLYLLKVKHQRDDAWYPVFVNLIFLINFRDDNTYLEKENAVAKGNNFYML
jgi:hypothetical protein